MILKKENVTIFSKYIQQQTNYILVCIIYFAKSFGQLILWIQIHITHFYNTQIKSFHEITTKKDPDYATLYYLQTKQ